MASGIYTITNITNGGTYVGSAKNLDRRWIVHRNRLIAGSHHSRHLQSAWNRYGEAVFRFEVLEEWEVEFLVAMEQWWINMLQPDYNIARVAGSAMLGQHHSSESRRRIGESNRIALTGRRITPEARANMVASFTPERRAAIGATKIGKMASDKTRAKMSAAWGPERRRAQGEKSAALFGGKPWGAARRAAQDKRKQEPRLILDDFHVTQSEED